MKKVFFVLLLILAASFNKAQAQAGDLHIGAVGGYQSFYKSPVYGLNLSYDISTPLQVSVTSLANFGFTQKDEFNQAEDRKLKIFSHNLDFRLFLINLETWAMGPSLGCEYLVERGEKQVVDGEVFDSLRDFNAFGFNVGWHLRVNVTDNLRLNGGWRYTSSQEEASRNTFYLGLGYAFNLY